MTKEELFQELVKVCKLYDNTMVEYHALLKARKALRKPISKKSNSVRSTRLN